MSETQTSEISGTSERRWATALAAWGIPQPILDAAPRDPWGLPVDRFAGRADRAMADHSGRSFDQAAAVLRDAPGSVLDVGAGAGAASLPLAELATEITAVDGKAAMLTAFSDRARAVGVKFRVVQGSWPSVGRQVLAHDLVMAHHVVYNVPAIGGFLAALSSHARRRVVLELTPQHPMSWLTPLWERFHDISRPTSPTFEDLVAVLEEKKVDGLHVESWQRYDPAAADGSDLEDPTARAALVAQRLCLSPDREPEVAEALRDMDDGYTRDVVCIAWDGTA